MPLSLSGGSGALPNPTKYMTVYNDGGTTAYFIPLFTSPNTWAA